MRIRSIFPMLFAPENDGGGAGGGGSGEGAPPAGDGKPPAGDGKPPAGDGKPPAVGGDGKPPAGDGAPPKGPWPDDWRTHVSADDKHQKVLGRFASPKELGESYIALNQKLSSGEYKKVEAFPDKGSAEDQAKWRKDNGVPDAADKYDLKGIEINEGQKERVDEFLKVAHASHMPAGQVKAAVDFYVKAEAQRLSDLEAGDKQHREATDDALRAEYGAEYKANINGVKTFLQGLPNGVGDKLMNGRLKDGTAFFNDPEIVRAFVAINRQMNPVPSGMDPANGGMAGAVEDELAGLKKLMADGSSEYWKGPKADKNQARYRELVSFQERNKGDGKKK